MSKEQGRRLEPAIPDPVPCLELSSLAYFIIVQMGKLRPPEGQGVDPGPLTLTPGLSFTSGTCGEQPLFLYW